jgi:hypothetical protein
MGDVDDPELYAAFPLGEFMKTAKGAWINANCADPQFRVRPDVANYGFRVTVYGDVADELATEYYLKWSNTE